jgi:hypothetical protein
MSAVGYGVAVTGRVRAAAYLPPTAARQPDEDTCWRRTTYISITGRPSIFVMRHRIRVKMNGTHPSRGRSRALAAGARQLSNLLLSVGPLTILLIKLLKSYSLVLTGHREQALPGAQPGQQASQRGRSTDRTLGRSEGSRSQRPPAATISLVL